jgi:hypothetical protein
MAISDDDTLTTPPVARLREHAAAAPMKGATMQQLGGVPSFSRASAHLTQSPA